MFRQRLLQPLRQRNHTVFLALSVPDDKLVILEIQTLNSAPNALHQPHAVAIEQAGHHMRHAIELFQQAPSSPRVSTTGSRRGQLARVKSPRSARA
jgi:hypothetical protein